MAMTMPKEKYLYRRVDNGELIEVAMTIGEMFAREDAMGFITLDDGSQARRARGAEFQRDAPPRAAMSEEEKERRRNIPNTPRAYERGPLISRVCGVHSSQVDQFNREKSSNSVHYRKDGTVEFQTRKARKEEMRRRGLFDKDGGDGDAQAP